MALAGEPGRKLTDKVRKIMKQFDNTFGSQTTQYAYYLDPADGLYKGGYKYELAATDLATISAYTYADLT